MTIIRLQRVVVDALEDIKAQDIQVYDTTELTELFDRVVVASATSNRQTRALAAHVRDTAKEKGYTVISTEGEETGEWVLVDLGDVVVHIMQPAIRQYYNLEELWGGKPVRMRIGAPPAARKGALAGLVPAAAARSGATAQDGPPAKKPAVKTGAATTTSRRATAAAGSKTTPRSPAKSTVASPAKAATKTPRKAATKPSAKVAAKVVAKTTTTATKSAATTATRRASTPTTAATKTAAAKTAATKTAATKTAAAKPARPRTPR